MWHIMQIGSSRGTPRRRREVVRAALAENAIRTQAQLLGYLRDRGHAVTQASVSRDLRSLGARKVGGVYRIAPRGEDGARGLGGLVESFTPAGPWLVVVRTPPGGAQRAAHEIDTGNWPELAGSVAGDDTIFLACREAAEQEAVLDRLRGTISGAAESGPIA